MAMTENEEGTATGGFSGAMTGAATGAMIGMAGGPAAPVTATAGALIGAAIGAFGGGLLGNSSANRARTLKNKAMKEAELARRQAILKEMGRQQQAESMVGAKASTAGKTSSTVAPSGNESGLIGQNVSTAGNF